MVIKQVEVVKSGQCRCCGRRIKSEYLFCIGCERKRMKVYNDCVGAGMSVYDAHGKVEAAYPQIYG